MTSSTSDGDKFFKRLADSLDEHSFVKLVLAKYRGPEPDLLRATLRRIQVRDADTLSFVYTYRTRDVTRNMPLAEGLQSLRERATDRFDGRDVARVDTHLDGWCTFDARPPCRRTRAACRRTDARQFLPLHFAASSTL
jgi:hypothetical protein